MTSYTNNSNAFRTQRNMRNHSTKYVGGKAVHVVIKRERQQEKFGASKLRARTASKAINARQGKGWAIIQGDIHHPDSQHRHRMSFFKSWDVVCALDGHPDFQSTLATPPRDYFWAANPAQKGRAIEMYEEKIHMLTNAPH